MNAALLVVAVAAVLVSPAAAAADNTLTISGGEARFRSEDAGIANRVLVEERPSGCSSAPCIRFYEPEDALGINAPLTECTPGETRGSYAIEVFCPKRLIRSVSVDIGPGEDHIRYTLADVPSSHAGETGADVITGGEGADAPAGGQGNDTLDGAGGGDELRGDDGDDTLAGGAGNDTIIGGAGADRIDAGAGDDSVSTIDGERDVVHCGPGVDSVAADTADELVDCESGERQSVTPATSRPAAADTRRPRLSVGGSSAQRIRRNRRTIRIAATSSERGLVQATGFLDAGGVNRRLRPVSGRVSVGGAGVELVLTLSARDVRAVSRDLRRRRRPRVKLTLSAVDDAGNTSAARRVVIALR